MAGQAARLMRGCARVVLAAALVCGVAVHGQAVSRPPSKKAPETTQQARISAANQGGIANWRVVNDHSLLIQGQDLRWYKAVLMSSCYGLPRAARVGFESNIDGSFDRFSAIRVGSQSCPLASLTETGAPKAKAGRPSASS